MKNPLVVHPPHRGHEPHANMTRYIIVILLLFVFTTPVLHAQTTPTTSPVEDTEGTVNEDIKERVRKVRENSDPAVMGVKTVLQTTFGIIGTLQKVVGSTLQVQSYQGKIKVIELDRNAIIVQGNRTVTKEEVELNTPVLVMGDISQDQSLLGKRVIISDATIFPSRRSTTAGTYEQSTTRALTFTPSYPPDSERKNVTLTNKTTFYNKLHQTIRRTDIKRDDQIIVVTSADNESTALRVYDLTLEP